MGGEASEGEAERESRVKNGDKRDKQTGLETGGGGGGGGVEGSGGDRRKRRVGVLSGS